MSNAHDLENQQLLSLHWKKNIEVNVYFHVYEKHKRVLCLIGKNELIVNENFRKE